jgi:predicted transglutaminase-like cysteine proteinase
MQSIYHPALGQNVNFQVTQVPEGGDSQTSAVIEMMAEYARQDSSSAEIQGDARQALAQYPDMAPEESVFWWVKRRLQFVRDEETAKPFQAGMPVNDVVVETLIRPRDMSVICEDGSCNRQGDCDDFAMYTASLLLALGIPAAFVTVAADPNSTDYSHVYVAAYPQGRGRVPLDTSHGGNPGWETDRATKRREWPASGDGSLMGILILVIGAWLLCRW